MSDKVQSVTNTAGSAYSPSAAYFNLSMVDRAIFMGMPGLAAEYTAKHMKSVYKARTVLGDNDLIVIRLSKEDVSPRTLAAMVADMTLDNKKDVTMAGDVLLALSKVNPNKVRSALDVIRDSNYALYTSVLAFMVHNGYGAQ